MKGRKREAATEDAEMGALRSELVTARQCAQEQRERAGRLEVELAGAKVETATLSFERDTYQARLAALECAMVLVTDQLRQRMRKAYGPEAVATRLNVSFDPDSKSKPWSAEYALAT